MRVMGWPQAQTTIISILISIDFLSELFLVLDRLNKDLKRRFGMLSGNADHKDDCITDLLQEHCHHN